MADVDLSPKLALRVGVTGHRHLSSEAADQLRPRVKDALKAIKLAVEDVASSSLGAYRSEERRVGKECA